MLKTTSNNEKTPAPTERETELLRDDDEEEEETERSRCRRGGRRRLPLQKVLRWGGREQQSALCLSLSLRFRAKITLSPNCSGAEAWPELQKSLSRHAAARAPPRAHPEPLTWVLPGVCTVTIKETCLHLHYKCPEPLQPATAVIMNWRPAGHFRFVAGAFMATRGDIKLNKCNDF